MRLPEKVKAWILREVPGSGWRRHGKIWTRVSNTTFTTNGDTTILFHLGLKLRWEESSVAKTAWVVSSSEAASVTTVIITGDVMAASPDEKTNFYSSAEAPNEFVSHIRQTATEMRVGTATSYVEIDADGDTTFVKDAGLPFGEIYVNGNTTQTAIAASGKANKVQVTVFGTNGQNNNMTPDHTNDHVTVVKPGRYFCAISITVDSVAGAGAEFRFSLYRNNGGTEFPNVHSHRTLSGGGGESGSLSLNGIVNLNTNNTMELWVWNETNTQNLIVADCTMSFVQIGGRP